MESNRIELNSIQFQNYCIALHYQYTILYYRPTRLDSTQSVQYMPARKPVLRSNIISDDTPPHSNTLFHLLCSSPSIFVLISFIRSMMESPAFWKSVSCAYHEMERNGTNESIQQSVWIRTNGTSGVPRNNQMKWKEIKSNQIKSNRVISHHIEFHE